MCALVNFGRSRTLFIWPAVEFDASPTGTVTWRLRMASLIGGRPIAPDPAAFTVIGCCLLLTQEAACGQLGCVKSRETVTDDIEPFSRAQRGFEHHWRWVRVRHSEVSNESANPPF